MSKVKNLKKSAADFENDLSLPEVKRMGDFLNDAGLVYAHYVIQHRALINIDGDGMKPVARRILYAMMGMGLKPNSKKAKGARVAGETMGKYHPHGSSAIEDAQARLGQTHAMRIPLFEVQGDLGPFTGSKPAAARYYEITFNKQGWELVKDISLHAAEMKYTETGDDVEPVQLPVRFPYLLIQGTSGIAVGYASNIPSHNPNEVLDACIAYYKGKLKKTEDVIKYMKGPDFPTGGEVIGIDGIKQYFETGTGTFLLRGKYEIKELSRGRSLIKFYELPYQVSAEQVKEAVYKAQDKGKLKEIAEIKDLSDGELGLNVSIYIKSGSNIENVIKELFELTPVQIKYSVNSTALSNRTPKQNLTILEIIKGFCEFRKECFIRKTNYRKLQITTELHKLNGLLAILVDIDTAISIIRTAENAEIANKKLQKKFKISEDQANHILSMKLRQLTKADKNDIINKHKQLNEELKFLESVLNNDLLLNKEIIKEIEETRKIISDDRRTQIVDISLEELEQSAKEQKQLEKQFAKGIDCFINVDKDNKIGKSLEKNKNTKFTINSLNNIFAINSEGYIYKIQPENIPVNSSISFSSLCSGCNDIIGLSKENATGFILVVSNEGNINIVKANTVKEETKLTSLLPEEELVLVKYIETEEELNSLYVGIVDELGRLVKFPAKSIRKTNSGAGLISGCNMDAPVVGVCLLTDENILVTESTKEIKYTASEDCPSKSRGTKGYLVHKLTKDDKIVKVYSSDLKDNMIITNRAAKGTKRNS